MHHWQDFVLSAGSLIFTAALVPSLLSKHKPALSTSLMTGVVLAIFVVVYTTLSLWFTAFSTSLNCLAWLALAVQKYFQEKSVAVKRSESRA